MNFDDLKERFLAELKASWEKINESSLYIKFREFYDSLNPQRQIAFNISAAFFILLLVFSVPYGFYSSANEMILDFEYKRDLTRDLITSTRESKKNSTFSNPPDLMQLQSQAQSIIQQAQLLPEQTLSVSTTEEKSSLLPGSLQQGLLIVRLSKLNLRQVIDIGTELQGIHSGVKMTSFQMELNSTDARYIDATYTLSAISLPAVAAESQDKKDEQPLNRNSTPPPEETGS